MLQSGSTHTMHAHYPNAAGKRMQTLFFIQNRQSRLNKLRANGSSHSAFAVNGEWLFLKLRFAFESHSTRIAIK